MLGPSSNRSFVKAPAQDGQERIWLVVDVPQLPHVIDDSGKIKRAELLVPKLRPRSGPTLQRSGVSYNS